MYNKPRHQFIQGGNGGQNKQLTRPSINFSIKRFSGGRSRARYVVKSHEKKRRGLVVSDLIRMEDETYKIKVMSQQQQGKWKICEAVTNRVITWTDM